jgi:3-hydroxyisobutyrate dehydrogenase-like beta-hydroxyacid dehydrogenase
MSVPAIGLLHPGRMGAAVGHRLTDAGHRVSWCADGRSPATAARAEEAGLEPVADLAELTAASDLIISLCPPAAAERLAASVAETGFGGTFVEANAVSPARVRHIAGLFTAAHVVDGATARLYLSGPGPEAARVAGLFAGSAVEAIVVDGGIGQASALKMAYGSYNKAASALAAVSHALADTYGVGDHLLAEARRGAADHLSTPERLSGVAARAWRWAPEMDEAAAAMAEANLPDELALAAAAVLRRWDDDRDDFTIALPDVLDHLHER